MESLENPMTKFKNIFSIDSNTSWKIIFPWKFYRILVEIKIKHI